MSKLIVKGGGWDTDGVLAFLCEGLGSISSITKQNTLTHDFLIVGESRSPVTVTIQLGLVRTFPSSHRQLAPCYALTSFTCWALEGQGQTLVSSVYFIFYTQVNLYGIRAPPL